VQCFLPDTNTSAVDHSVFGRVWQQYLTVPLLLVVILFPLINCKSPTFFTKLNSLGRFCTLFIVLLCLHPSYSWAGGIMFPGCLSVCVWMHTYLCMCQCMPGQRNSLALQQLLVSSLGVTFCCLLSDVCFILREYA